MDNQPTSSPNQTPPVNPGPTGSSRLSPSPEPSNGSSGRPLIVVLVILILAAGATGWWFFLREDSSRGDVKTNAGEETTQTNAEAEQSALKTVTYTSGLQHKSTVLLEVPSGWKVEEDETVPEGAADYSLKSMVITSLAGHSLHIFDRDGLGGYCEPDSESYTLTKEIKTKTENLSFKDYDIPTVAYKHHVLLLETENTEWSVPAHDALKEGESATDSCNITSYSSVGTSGIFLVVSSSASMEHISEERLGWEAIKEDTAFVKMLESIVAEDKSTVSL